MTCENAHFGCPTVVKLDLLPHHLKACEHNPKRPIPCEQGCGLTVPKDEMKEHNCVRDLRALVTTHEQKMGEMQKDLSDCKYQLAEQRREINLLKDRVVKSFGGGSNAAGGAVGAMAGAAAAGSSGGSAGAEAVRSVAGATSRTVTNQIQDEEVVRWAAGLPRARVARWGGMISTPDAVLQVITNPKSYTRVKFEIVSDVTPSRGKPVQFWPRQNSVYVEP